MTANIVYKKREREFYKLIGIKREMKWFALKKKEKERRKTKATIAQVNNSKQQQQQKSIFSLEIFYNS